MTYITLTVPFILFGVLFAALGLPLKLGKIRPNWWYGFRTPKSLSNETIWYEVNRRTGTDMIFGGAAMAISGLVLLALRDSISLDVAAVIQVVISVAAIGWMIVHGFMVLRRL